MLHYLKRARALAATVHRLDAEVRDLRVRLQDSEDRCRAMVERARQETLAAETRIHRDLQQVERAATGLIEHVQRTRGAASAPPVSSGPPVR